MKIEDLSGQRFGKLTVVRLTDHRKGESLVWECRCDCGRTVLVVDSDLIDGKIETCGHGGKFRKSNIQAREKKETIRERKNLSGMRFGRLTVLPQSCGVQVTSGDRKYIKWRCQCDCGNSAFVNHDALMSGNTKSCGCLRKERYTKEKKDLAGQKFGKLTAMRPTNQRENRCIVWECRCDCGRTVFVGKGRLENGSVKSCGCEDVTEKG